MKILILLFLTALPASAQNNGLPRNLLPPELLPQPRLTPQEQETIQRALVDLKSENPELRAGAVMLLGKYHAREAKAAVVQAMDDPSARVRRAALVSIAEWRNGLTVNSVEPILIHIADEDVEVRRSVSAMIPQLMNIWRNARMVRPDFSHREFNDAVKFALVRALQDEDAIVRRNVLMNQHNLNLATPPEVYVALLNDPDQGVRLEAIPLAISYAQAEQWLEPAKAIITGEDPKAKLRLTAELGRRGSEQGVELLRLLASSDNLQIATESRLALLRWTGDPTQLDWLVKALAADRLTQDQGQRLLQIMRSYRELSAPLAPALTELRSSVLRLEAVRLFLSLDQADQNPEIMSRLLTDTNQEIRMMAVTHIYSRPELIDDDRLLSLMDNPYPDVRASLVQLAVRQPRAKADEMLLDLMLDESVDVRIASIEAISGLRLDGWTDIVASSIEDPDIAMQRTAIVIIIRERQFPKREEILRKFVKENPKSPLTPRIRTAIGGGKLIEIDMGNL